LSARPHEACTRCRDTLHAEAGVSDYVARVYVTLKPTVNDPQGLTIRGALHSLGFADVSSVRAGKYLELRLTAPDDATANERIRAMCHRLLANPVIEDSRFELTEAGSAT
jgi:phosphoribosylformylglycinamidine synthase